MLKPVQALLALGLLALAVSQAAFGKEPPVFADYPAPPPYTGKVAPVDFHSDPDAVRFRTMLRAAAKGRPNFAGHMIVTTWGCGTDCNVVALIDARNGKVYFGPIAEIGVEYWIGSNLLIVNPPEDLKAYFGDDVPDWAFTRYFFWNDRKNIRPDTKPR